MCGIIWIALSHNLLLFIEVVLFGVARLDLLIDLIDVYLERVVASQSFF